MSATLWWVRHAPTHARTMIGWTDRAADLSDTALIGRLSRLIPGDAAVISSDLARAVTTADALSGDRPRLPHDADLREIHFGAWEDRAHDEIHTSEPAALRAFWDNPGDSSAPGGESWNALRHRVDAAAARLAERGGDILVVAHFGPVLTQIQRARGISTTEVFAQKIEPLSLTKIRFDGVWHLESVNHPA